jgi:hypothetical protein
VTLKFASQGSGTGDYVYVSDIASFLKENLPTGSTVEQEAISTGSGVTGYLLEAGMCTIARGQNAAAATVGLEGKPPLKDVRAIIGTMSTNCHSNSPSRFCQKDRIFIS